MSILKVSNVHLDLVGTNRIEYVDSDNVVRLTSNGALSLPTGTTAERPTAQAGLIRYNTTSGEFEGYNASAWGAIGGFVDTTPLMQKGNAVNVTANAAFDKANAANSYAEAQSVTANLAYDKANSANVLTYQSDLKAAAAFLTSNLAYDKANAANIEASYAFDRANVANLIANYANTSAIASFNSANSAASGNSNIRVYSAPATWTKPNGLKAISVHVIGAGGKGGDAGANPTTVDSIGSGGGGGGYAWDYLQASEIPGPVAVTAGAYSTSSFGAYASATAGANGATGVWPETTLLGGAAGVGSSGIVNGSGRPGGSSDGNNIAGETEPEFNNGGFVAGFGDGGFGGEFLQNQLNVNVPSGLPGKGFGAGGGGSGGQPNGGTGGAGSNGAIIIEEYY